MTDSTVDTLASLLTLHTKAIPLVAHGSATHHRREDHASEEGCGWTQDDTNRALEGCAYDVYLGLRFYHVDPLPWIQQACADSESMYVDHEFPTYKAVFVRPGTDSPTRLLAPGIITSSNCRDFRSNGPQRARRILHFMERAEKNWVWIRASSLQNSALFSSQDSVNPRNILQGAVGNCGFCAGFASLAADWPDVLRAAFGDHSENSLQACGAYSVRLFPKGQERYLLLDDYILCCNDGSKRSPSMHSLRNSDLWVRLLEKVFVKLQGSYASLDGYYKYESLYRHPARALQLLTGARIALEIHYDTDIKDTVYDVLCQSQGTFAHITHCRKRVQGLHLNHGYSLLWLGEAAGLRLVCLRNPHGRGSYTGNYGFGSNVWDSVDGNRVSSQLLSMDSFVKCPRTGRVTWSRGGDDLVEYPIGNSADDGIFFMEFDSFVECFPITTVVGPMSPPISRYSPTVTGDSPVRGIPDYVHIINKSQLYHLKAIFEAAVKGIS